MSSTSGRIRSYLLLHELDDVLGADVAEVVAEVLDAAVLVPERVELVLEYLGALLHGQTRFVQTQLAHVHVVDARDEEDGRRAVRVDLHLARDPLAVEVSEPPALFVMVGVVVAQLIGRSRKRQLEEALLAIAAVALLSCVRRAH